MEISLSAKAFVIRFPTGDFEYDLTVPGRALPAVGETLRRQGVLWLVTRITHENVEIVHVERVDARKSTERLSGRSGYLPDVLGTPILMLRFPDGDVEYRSTRGELPIGAQVRARGCLWRIHEYTENGAAILKSAEVPGVGTAGGRTVNPSPIGDAPLAVEVLIPA